MARTVTLCQNNKKKPHIKPGRVLYGASIAGATLEQLHSSTDRRKGQIMKYQIVNEELQIASCSIADLTMEQVQHFLKQWHPGDSIGTLTLFFENETGLLVLNRDNKSYEIYKDIAEAFLKANKDEQKEIIEKAPKGIEETFLVLNNCIKRRTIGEEISRAGKGVISCNDAEVLREIYSMYSNEDKIIALAKAFNYGMMQGKRAERAKKKH